MRQQLVVVAQVAGLQAGEAMCMDNLTAILAAGKSDFFFSFGKASLGPDTNLDH